MTLVAVDVQSGLNMMHLVAALWSNPRMVRISMKLASKAMMLVTSFEPKDGSPTSVFI